MMNIALTIIHVAVVVLLLLIYIAIAC